MHISPFTYTAVILVSLLAGIIVLLLQNPTLRKTVSDFVSDCGYKLTITEVHAINKPDMPDGYIFLQRTAKQ